jgi:hypothetical protein
VRGGIQLGQGVGRFEEEYLRSALEDHDLTSQVRLVSGDSGVAGRDVVHKRRPDNVLLGPIERVTDATYAAALRLTGDNELLLDHRTGQQVQGIGVVEAIRQMFVGIFEIGYCREHPDREYYVVWGDTTFAFHSFLFLLPTELVGRSAGRRHRTGPGADGERRGSRRMNPRPGPAPGGRAHGSCERSNMSYS